MPRGKAIVLSEEQIKDMEKLYMDGLRMDEIGEIYSLCTSSIHNIFIRNGINTRPAHTRIGFKHTKEFCDNISRIHKGKIVSDKTRRKISESKRCHYNGLNGYGHVKKHSQGYLQCYVPEHPNARSDGYVMLHTVLMEIHLGRYLNSDEVVHHINGVKDDNSLDNLMLMSRHNHRSYHITVRNKKGGDIYELNHHNR